VVDQQDSPVVPSHGTRAVVTLNHTFASPEVEVPGITRTNKDLTQAEVGVSWFHSPTRRSRLFVVFSGGTSFDDTPLPTRQFTLGYPYVLDAFGVGERRGDHYAVATVGAMHQVGRLPDFMGGPIFAAGWLENGSAFNTHENADINTQVGLGVMFDTLVGPVLAGAGIGIDGGWRTIFGVGRIFR
jgi:NTE family protein